MWSDSLKTFIYLMSRSSTPSSAIPEFANNMGRNVTCADWSRPTGGPALIDMDNLNTFVNAGTVIWDDGYGRGELPFARKFPNASSQLTDFIDRHLINRPMAHKVSLSGPEDSAGL